MAGCSVMGASAKFRCWGTFLAGVKCASLEAQDMRNNMEMCWQDQQPLAYIFRSLTWKSGDEHGHVYLGCCSQKCQWSELLVFFSPRKTSTMKAVVQNKKLGIRFCGVAINCLVLCRICLTETYSFQMEILNMSSLSIMKR